MSLTLTQGNNIEWSHLSYQHSWGLVMTLYHNTSGTPIVTNRNGEKHFFRSADAVNQCQISLAIPKVCMWNDVFCFPTNKVLPQNESVLFSVSLDMICLLVFK